MNLDSTLNSKETISYEYLLDKFQKVPVVEYPNKVCSNPTVSICVLTYQHEKYLVDCLEGILAQEVDFDFEIIIGEDQSSDNTRRIAKEYAEKHEKIVRLFLHSRENNIWIDDRPTGRFNLLYSLFKSRGQFIALCEGDDYWTDASKLQKQVNALGANPNIHLSFHPSNKINDKDDSLLGVAGYFGSKSMIINAATIIKSNAAACPTQSIMMRRSVVDNLPRLLFRSPGAHLFIQSIASVPNGAIYLPDTMAVYRVNSNSSVMKNVRGTRSGYFNWLMTSNDCIREMNGFFGYQYKHSINYILYYNTLKLLRSRFTTLSEKYKAILSLDSIFAFAIFVVRKVLSKFDRTRNSKNQYQDWYVQ